MAEKYDKHARQRGESNNVNFVEREKERRKKGAKKKKNPRSHVLCLLSVSRALPAPSLLPDRLQLPLQLHCSVARAPHFSVRMRPMCCRQWADGKLLSLLSKIVVSDGIRTMKSEETAADNRGGHHNKSIFYIWRIVTTPVMLGYSRLQSILQNYTLWNLHSPTISAKIFNSLWTQTGPSVLRQETW